MLQVVIPAFNEEGRLPRTLRELRRFVRRHRGVLGVVEVIVVDNASTDATADVAARASSATLPVRVIGCAVPGKGAAVAAGVAATDAELVAYLDADGATDLQALLAAVRLHATGADVVIGSRAVADADCEARHSALRAAGARCYRGLAGRVVPGVRDTQCGFKVLRGDLARRTCARLRTHGFSFDVELLARLQREGAVMVEVPVRWTDVPGSTFDPVRHGAAAFRDLAAIAWLLRRERALPAPVSIPVSLPTLAPRPALEAPA
ncbi:glycosyltransferase [Nocardioides sp.]|uniref:glycosyltransferase n=1 Tax=Nocardioides sp. TaxID=35761 RepID=UPI003510E31D